MSNKRKAREAPDEQRASGVKTRSTSKKSDGWGWQGPFDHRPLHSKIPQICSYVGQEITVGKDTRPGPGTFAAQGLLNFLPRSKGKDTEKKLKEDLSDVPDNAALSD